MPTRRPRLLPLAGAKMCAGHRTASIGQRTATDTGASCCADPQEHLAASLRVSTAWRARGFGSQNDWFMASLAGNSSGRPATTCGHRRPKVAWSPATWGPWPPATRQSWPVRSGRTRAVGSDLLDPLQSLAEVTEPGVLVLAHQPDAPCQRITAAPSYAGVNQRVEHHPLVLPESGHDWHRECGEHHNPVGETDAPRDLAAVRVFGFAGDFDPVLPGFLAEPAAAALPRCGELSLRGSLGCLRPGNRHDYGDLLAVEPDLEAAVKPLLRQPAREPAAKTLNRRRLLLAALCTHVIMITQHRPERNPL